MKKNCSVIVLLLLVIALFSGCGGDSTVPVITTPTPVTTPSVTPSESEIISTLTELESQQALISAKNGGTVSLGDIEVEIADNSMSEDTSVEISRVNINSNGALKSSDVTTGYEISTGLIDEDEELTEPAKVTFKNVSSNQRPALYNGQSWFPVDDYEYDPNTGELSLWINFIDNDTNEYIESGGEESSVETPIVIALNNDTGYDKELITNNGNGHFKIFYNNSEEDYVKTMEPILEQAYEYYQALGYKEPVKALINRKTGTSKYIYTYVYSNMGNKYDGYKGVAWTAGYLGYNRNLLDLSEPVNQSTFYHEILHLIQYAYSGDRSTYKSWFSESMCTSMQYYAINKPQEKYDLSDGRWNRDLLWDEIFNQMSSNSQNNYNKYIIWSYMMNRSGLKNKLFQNMMTDLKPADIVEPEKLNMAFKKNVGQSLPLLMNDLIEDYYVYGKFFNSDYFSKLSDRSSGQPYSAVIDRDSINPGTWAENYVINPLSMRYICYKAGNYEGNFELNFSNLSSNCKIRIFPMKKDNDGSYSISPVEEVTVNVTKKYTFGSDMTHLFVFIENTSMSSNAKVSVSTWKS